MHTCNLRTWEGEAGELGAQGQPELYNKFKCRLHEAVSNSTRLWLEGFIKNIELDTFACYLSTELMLIFFVTFQL